MLECRDGTLYTGITNDLERRLREHNEGTGARYTRGRGPSRVVYRKSCVSKSEALKLEMAVKSLSRGEKLLLVQKSKTG